MTGARAHRPKEHHAAPQTPRAIHMGVMGKFTPTGTLVLSRAPAAHCQLTVGDVRCADPVTSNSFVSRCNVQSSLDLRVFLGEPRQDLVTPRPPPRCHTCVYAWRHACAREVTKAGRESSLRRQGLFSVSRAPPGIQKGRGGAAAWACRVACRGSWPAQALTNSRPLVS